MLRSRAWLFVFQHAPWRLSKVPNTFKLPTALQVRVREEEEEEGARQGGGNWTCGQFSETVLACLFRTCHENGKNCKGSLPLIGSKSDVAMTK